MTELQIKAEDNMVFTTADHQEAEAMDVGDGDPDDSLQLHKYLSSFRQGPTAAVQTADILVQIVRSSRTAPKRDKVLQDEFSRYIDALLDSPKANPLYLHILAHLSDGDLQDLVMILVIQCLEQQQIEKCCAILFSFLRIMPAASSDELVVGQIRETCLALLTAAKAKSSSYCNEYRQTALMKFLPVILAQRTFSAPSREFLISIIPEVVKVYVSAVFQWSFDRSLVVIPVDNAWISLFQTLTKIFAVCCENLKVPKPPEFWSIWKTSVPALKVWWKQLSQWRSILDRQDRLPLTVVFWLRFTFESFLIYFYDQIKVECGLPERRPFLLDIPAVYATSAASKRTASQLSKTLRKLQEVFLLAERVRTSLETDDGTRNSEVLTEIASPSSPMFLSFQYDYWTYHKRSGTAAVPDGCPSWLTVQKLARDIASSLSSEPLSATLFGEMVILSAKLQLHNSRQEITWFGFDDNPDLKYICDDSEVLKFFCAAIIGHMATQPVERSSDEFLSSLLVFMQPVIDKCTDLLRAVIAALLMRQKCVFKQFFTYICSPEIIAEISGLVGRMALELTPEPLASTTTSHNTRGAIRGSTDVLQTELQKLAISAISNSNVFLAVQRYISDNKETLSVVLFQQQQQPLISPPRRGRSSALTS